MSSVQRGYSTHQTSVKLQYTIIFPDLTSVTDTSQFHTTKVWEMQTGSLVGVKFLGCIVDYKHTVSTESGGHQPVGFNVVQEKVQVIRDE